MKKIIVGMSAIVLAWVFLLTGCEQPDRSKQNIAGTFEYDKKSIFIEMGDEGSVEPLRNGIENKTLEFSIAPDAPGISIDSTTGKISVGTDAEPINREFTITAMGIGNYEGTMTATININVYKGIKGSLLYDAISILPGASGSQNAQWANGDANQVVSYSIDPEVAGVSVDSKTGQVNIDSSADLMDQIFTVTASGTGDYGGQIEGTIHVNVQPNAISHINVIQSNNSLELTWPEFTGISVASYHVSWKMSTEETWSQEIDTTSPSYKIVSLLANIQYNIRIRAKYVSGKYSDYVQTTASTVDAAPTAPTGIQVNPSITSIDIAWDASTDDVSVSGYYVSWKQQSATDWSGEQATSASKHTIPGLDINVSYDIRIRAKDNEGQFGPYGYIRTSTVDNVPSKPDGIIIIPSSKALRVTWDASTDDDAVASYHISWKLRADTTWSNEQSSATTSYTINNLLSENEYDIRIRAKDTAGQYSEYNLGVKKTSVDTNPHSDTVCSVKHNSEGSLLVSASADDTVKLWDGNGVILKTFTGHSGNVLSADFSPDASKIVSGGEDKNLKIWNVNTGKLEDTLSGHTGSVLSVAWSPDRTKVASGSSDDTVKIWNPDTGAVEKTLSHSGDVRQIAWSPDGTVLASASNDYTVNIWNANTGQLVKTLTHGTKSSSSGGDNVRSLAWSPDGDYIVTGVEDYSASSDTNIRIWEVSDGTVLRNIASTNAVYAVAWSPDGTKIAAGGYGKKIRILDPNTGAELHFIQGGGVQDAAINSIQFKTNEFITVSYSISVKTIKMDDKDDTKVNNTTSLHNEHVYQVVWNNEKTLMASTSADDKVRIWDANGIVKLELSGHSGNVYSASINTNEVASGGADKTIKIWSISPGDMGLVRTFFGHSEGVSTVAWSPDGTKVASGSSDDTVKIWNPDTGAVEKTLSHSGDVRQIAWSPDGTMLASASNDYTVNIWNANTGQLVKTLTHGTKSSSSGGDNVRSLAWSPDGDYIVTGVEDYSASSDTNIRIWKVSDGTVLRNIASTNAVYAVAWSPDGTKIAAGGYGEKIRILDPNTGAELHFIQGGGVQDAAINSIQFKSDTALTIAVSENVKELAITNKDPSKTITTETTSHSSTVNSVKKGAGGYMVTSSADGTVKLWSPNGVDVALTLTGHSGSVDSAALSPDSTRTVTGGNDKTVKIWKNFVDDDGIEIWAASTRGLERTFFGHSGSVLTVDWSPDGTKVASGSSDDTVKIWNPDTGAVEKTLSHSGDVRQIAWSPDGTVLASASNDYTVNIWNANTGQLVKTLTHGTKSSSSGGDNVRSLAWSPDGDYIVTGVEDYSASSDTNIRIWKVSDGTVLRNIASTNAVYAVAWSPDGTKIAAGGYGKAVFIWSSSVIPSTTTPLATLSSLGDNVHSLSWKSNDTIYVAHGIYLQQWKYE